MIPLRCRPATSGRMLIREADDDDFRLANDDADGKSCPSRVPSKASDRRPTLNLSGLLITGNLPRGGQKETAPRPTTDTSRLERQMDGIAKAKDRGVKFGR